MDQMQWTNNVASKLDASSDIGIFQHHQTHLGVSLTNVIGGAVKKTSFPKRVTFDVFADSTKAPIQIVCPNCTMYGEMKAYDVFDEEYVPIKQYCDATDVCSNVQFELKYVQSVAGLLKVSGHHYDNVNEELRVLRQLIQHIDFDNNDDDEWDIFTNGQMSRVLFEKFQNYHK
ncbi:hypothetical protein RFI_22468 [Reticulomyxa filosa]|uniref:Uncharacterized protein n=1 Tax=Reticulomyxa filosa TaxID=46433 RepID=X6MNC6_RETFI|nr:hypothetical protein RFI_22468 [Reticulomyxa filosa]|eukprot:ETO14902.1 hypothetical protein RFI_22468 [Reticulomyxa filosa]